MVTVCPEVVPVPYDMNGRYQMQGGKNWILSKEINAVQYNAMFF
jgi:hypothetical protein